MTRDTEQATQFTELFKPKPNAQTPLGAQTTLVSKTNEVFLSVGVGKACRFQAVIKVCFNAKLHEDNE